MAKECPDCGYSYAMRCRCPSADHEAALAAAVRDAEERTVERLSAMLPSDLKVIADIGFPHTAVRIQGELAAKDARIAELEQMLKGMKFTCSVLRLSKGHAQRKLESLRTAIEAKAVGHDEKAKELRKAADGNVWPDQMHRYLDEAERLEDRAAELRALLETKP